MTPSDKPTDAELMEIAKAATPGTWEWWNGCSWWRLGSTDPEFRGSDPTVVEPTKHWKDGHPDLLVRDEDKDYLVAFQPSVAISLLERLQAAEQRADAAEAEAARLNIEEGTWWKTVVGGSHTPSGGVSVKHLHPLTVKPIYEACKGTPVADVIAGLIFNMEITSNREQFLVEDANERAATSEASRLSVEGERDELRREYLRVIDHLQSWVDDHHDEATTETWAIFHCAEKIRHEHMRSQDPGPHPCGEQPGANVAATAALAPDTQNKGASL